MTSLVAVYGNGSPTLIISCLASFVSGKIKLQKEETDKFAWVTFDEAKNYDLIDGIYDELAMAEQKRQGKHVEWKRS